MTNPPPMAEQFLYDLRRMIAIAKQRILLRRYVSRLGIIPEETEEDLKVVTTAIINGTHAAITASLNGLKAGVMGSGGVGEEDGVESEHSLGSTANSSTDDGIGEEDEEDGNGMTQQQMKGNGEGVEARGMLVVAVGRVLGALFVLGRWILRFGVLGVIG